MWGIREASLPALNNTVCVVVAKMIDVNTPTAHAAKKSRLPLLSRLSGPAYPFGVSGRSRTAAGGDDEHELDPAAVACRPRGPRAAGH